MIWKPLMTEIFPKILRNKNVSTLSTINDSIEINSIHRNLFYFLLMYNFQTNSFQMVLATDEVYTYAIFNYINLVWSSHTEAGGKINVFYF